MDEPPLLKPEAVVPPSPKTSLGARLLNMFATPGDVFEEVKGSAGNVWNWLTPALIMGLVGVVALYITLSQPALEQSLREKQQKALDQQVQSGKLTREGADRALNMIVQSIKATLILGAAVFGFVLVFWWALILWALGRFVFKADIPFMKMAEVTGLSSVITVLEIIVKMLLVVSFSNPLASPSLVMLMKSPDPQNKLFAIFSALNVMTFWVMAVRAVGLAKMANVSFTRAAVWSFTIWFLLSALLLAAGSFLQATFGK
ncbi:MAG: hypothetical protein QOD03_69 [Verrucomicrobiota bacterium]|jgi:hypothetical protein